MGKSCVQIMKQSRLNSVDHETTTNTDTSFDGARSNKFDGARRNKFAHRVT